jgi:site-specific recombinase XerD
MSRVASYRTPGLSYLPQPEDAGECAERTVIAWLALADMLKARSVKPRTIEHYGWSVAKLGRWLRDIGGPEPVDALTEHITGHLSWLRDEGSAASTVETHYRHLRRAFGWWRKAGYLDADPVELVDKLPDPARGKLIPVVDVDQAAALIAACSPKSPKFADRRDVAMIELARAPGGPRSSELVGLKLADLDMRRRVVKIVAGKGGKDRWIPFGPAARQALSLYLFARAKHPLADRPELFLPTRNGYPPLTRSGWQQILKRRCAQAGVKHVHPHMWRHTAAADTRRAGLDPASANRLFGWTSAKMYDRYGASVADEIALQLGQAVAEQLDANRGV